MEVAAGRVEAQRTKLEQLNQKLTAANEAFEAARPTPTQAILKRLSAAKAAVAKASNDLRTLEQKHESAQLKEDAKRAKAEAAAKAAAEKAETAKHFTDEGLIKLCELRLNAETEIANSSDKNESVWKHVHKRFVAAINDGKVPESDMRSADSLQARFSREQSSFRFLCREIQRFMQSGASTDEIDDLKARLHRCIPSRPPDAVVALPDRALAAQGHDCGLREGRPGHSPDERPAQHGQWRERRSRGRGQPAG